MIQVTIAVPSMGRWVDHMGMSLARNLCGFPFNVHFVHPRGPYLGRQRELCAKLALEAKSDFLFFIDSDMQFPELAMARLLTRGKDIVGGLYYEKRWPLVSTIKLLDTPFDGSTFEWTPPKEPFEVAAVGTGFMCINLKRLTECMAPPYFANGDAENVDAPGEDVSFCLRARPLGLTVWCDPTIPLIHWGDAPYGKLD